MIEDARDGEVSKGPRRRAMRRASAEDPGTNTYMPGGSRTVSITWMTPFD